MCLHSITSREPEECGVGYKVFVLQEDGGFTPLYRRGENYCYRSNEWITDPNQFPLSRRAFWSSDQIDFQYETGFHLFTKFEDARELRRDFVYIKGVVVAKVRYRKAIVEGEFHVAGMDFPSTCIVAKEMFIEEIL
jgi:hypothetical protein